MATWLGPELSSVLSTTRLLFVMEGLSRQQSPCGALCVNSTVLKRPSLQGHRILRESSQDPPVPEPPHPPPQSGWDLVGGGCPIYAELRSTRRGHFGKNPQKPCLLPSQLWRSGPCEPGWLVAAKALCPAIMKAGPGAWSGCAVFSIHTLKEVQ